MQDLRQPLVQSNDVANNSLDEIRGVELTLGSMVRGGDIDEERLMTDDEQEKINQVKIKSTRMHD